MASSAMIIVWARKRSVGRRKRPEGDSTPSGTAPGGATSAVTGGLSVAGWLAGWLLIRSPLLCGALRVSGGAGHDGRGGGLLSPERAGDAPFVQHEDAVGEAEHLGQLRGDEHDGEALAREPVDLRVNLLLGPRSEEHTSELQSR